MQLKNQNFTRGGDVLPKVRLDDRPYVHALSQVLWAHNTVSLLNTYMYSLKNNNYS